MDPNIIALFSVYPTWLVVLTVAPALRSALTTLRWPKADAAIRAVYPLCEMWWSY